MYFLELEKLFGDCEIRDNKIIVNSNLAAVIKYIKENYGFRILKEIVAVDNNEDSIELIYRLYNFPDQEELLISTTVSNVAESITSVFDSALADEKEIYDLFGVYFRGHKDLKRIYLPDAWKGNPLRKNYKQTDERLDWND